MEPALPGRRCSIDHAPSRRTATIWRSSALSQRTPSSSSEPHGEVVHWNRAAESMFGYTRADVIGKALHDFLAPDRFSG